MRNFDLQLLALLASTVVFSYISLFLVSKYGAIDVPGKRSSHTTPTPRVGGISILLGMIYYLFGYHFCIAEFLGNVNIQIVLYSTFIMAALGIWDDHKDVSWSVRLLVQFVVAIGIACSDLRLRSIAGYNIDLLGYPLTIIWLVGFTNIFNFMDGLNGMTAGVSVCALLVLLVILPSTEPMHLIIGGLAVASAPYVVKNFMKGEVFIGDGGTYMLGFFFAVLALYIQRSLGKNFPFLFFVMMFMPYHLDASFTILRRLLNGENIAMAHREHLFQMLHIAGYSHTRVALMYMIATFLTSGLGYWMLGINQHYHIYVFLIPIALFMLYAKWVFKKYKVATK